MTTKNSITNKHGNICIAIFIMAFPLLLGITGCNKNQNLIKSEIDKNMGVWVDHKDDSYEYIISKKNKNEILKNVSFNNEQWRKEKITVALLYVSDIDKHFLSIGPNNAVFNISGDDIVIEGKEGKYNFTFENFKGIYFPKIVKLIK